MESEAIIGLINAQGVHPTQLERNKLPLIIKWAQTSGCSLLAITETHTTATDNPFTTLFFTHHHQVAHTSAMGKTAGVALVSIKPGFTISKRAEALGGRLLVAEVAGPTLKKPLVITVIYAPDSGKGEATCTRFWNECHKLVPDNTDLLLGDFNVTLRPEDSTSRRRQRPSRAALQALLEKKALVDIAYDGAPHTHTGMNGGIPHSARLDRVYSPLNSPLAPQQLPTANPRLSDHSPVRVVIKASLPPKAPI